MLCIRVHGKKLTKWPRLMINSEIPQRFMKSSIRNPLNTVISPSANEEIADEKKLPITSRQKEEALVQAPKKKEEALVQAPKKKKEKNPFAKELFLGRFDNEMLYFPEILDPKRLNSLQSITSSIQNIFQKVDSGNIDKAAKIPDDILFQLKKIGLFGQQVPAEYEGMELKATESARLAEVIGWDSSIFTTLAAHNNLGVKAIVLHGNDAQKTRYLPKLATGELTAAFCLSEANSGSDMGDIRTEAILSDDGKFYILNGSKAWVCNGAVADIFVVFGRTKISDSNDAKLSAFIVEREHGGVTYSNPEDMLGLRSCNVCSVNFDKTLVPVENILGRIDGGFHIAASILNSAHFIIGSSCAGLLKNLMNIAIEHAIDQTRFERSLSSFELIQKKLAKIACKIYAIESMTYFTAGIIDEDCQSDHSVESAMVKVFSSEAAFYCANECLQLLGSIGCLSGSQTERALRDIRVASMFGGTNEIVRMFIALSGCQHAVKELADSVRKRRNPLFYPSYVFKRVWEYSRQRRDNPKLNLDLAGYLHPSFLEGAFTLEYAVLRFQFCVEQALAKYGKEITDRQIVLDILANIAINIYAMTATLSRASRSYCIGLPNSTSERLIALTFCKTTVDEIKANVNDVLAGPQLNSDLNYHHIATAMFKNRRYCAEHPLSRSWN